MKLKSTKKWPKSYKIWTNFGLKYKKFLSYDSVHLSKYFCLKIAKSQNA